MKPATRQTPSAFQRSGLGVVELSRGSGWHRSLRSHVSRDPRRSAAERAGLRSAHGGQSMRRCRRPTRSARCSIAGHTYETIARELGDLPGAGVHARHRGAGRLQRRPASRRARRPGRARRQLPAARQPPPAQPRRNPVVIDWVTRRAAARADGRRWLISSPVALARAAPAARPRSARPRRRGQVARLGDPRRGPHRRPGRQVGLPVLRRRLRPERLRQGRRVVQIEGDPDAPHSRGRLCPKGSATLQLTPAPRASSTSSTAARTAPTGSGSTSRRRWT